MVGGRVIINECTKSVRACLCVLMCVLGLGVHGARHLFSLVSLIVQGHDQTIEHFADLEVSRYVAHRQNLQREHESIPVPGGVHTCEEWGSTAHTSAPPRVASHREFARVKGFASFPSRLHQFQFNSIQSNIHATCEDTEACACAGVKRCKEV